jgi:hypothetical protein
LFFALLPGTAGTLPKLSLSKLLDASSAVVQGRVIRHWSAWDGDHQFIWTHYELRANEVLVGRNRQTFTISEPGGVVGEIGLQVSNSVPFTDGEEVLVFLHGMPNGMIRVTGGSQGKFRVFTTFAGKKIRGEAHVFRGADIDGLKSAIRTAKSAREAK